MEIRVIKLTRPTEKEENDLKLSSEKMVSLLAVQNKLLKEKCAALEELVRAMKEELNEEMYRHDRLQDFEVAESKQLAEARETLRQIRALAKSYFGEEG